MRKLKRSNPREREPKVSLVTEFVPLPLGELRKQAALCKADGWRFIQTHAVHTDNGIDLYYSFMKNGKVVNYCVQGVTKDDAVPSITDLFLAAFVFENEARELFGVDMHDIVLDFQGALYAPAEREPMTFITPEQKAAREKARAKKQSSTKSAEGSKGGETRGTAAPSDENKRIFVMTPERQARLDAKMSKLSDEKRKKVEEALKARAAEAQEAAASPQPVEKQASPSDKTSQSQASLSQADKREALSSVQDTQLEGLLDLMDESKAALVRTALENAKGMN